MTPGLGRRGPRDTGFTLLELIVAAAIMALIAVFSWRGLDALIREREAIAASQSAIDAVQRAFARLERDALLAGDAQLDESSTMRLVAGTSSIDGTVASTVEYRLVGDALVRTVVGADVAPLVVLDGVAALSMEAWAPAPGGGAWVRTKAAANEPPRLPATGPNAGQGAGGNPVGASDAATRAANAAPGTALPLRSSGTPNGPGVARGNQQPPGPVVAAATGIRLTFARADGSRMVRAFMVGGG